MLTTYTRMSTGKYNSASGKLTCSKLPQSAPSSPPDSTAPASSRRAALRRASGERTHALLELPTVLLR